MEQQAETSRFKDLMARVDKTLIASIILHALVFGWGLFTFSSKALEVMPEDSVAVDVVSDDQLARAMAGAKTGTSADSRGRMTMARIEKGGGKNVNIP